VQSSLPFVTVEFEPAAMSSSMVNVLRLAALGTICFFSLIVLGVGAHLIFLSEQVGFYYTFTAFAVAIAALTLIMLPPLLIIGLVRRGALLNYVVVEVAVLGLFWVLWLATAAYSANALTLLPIDCNFNFEANGFIASCHEPQALHAFSWLNWLILTVYWPFLLITAIVQQNRGNPVWTKSVREVNMFAAAPVVVATQVYPPQQQTMMYAPQPVQQQPQMGYPPNTPGATYAPVPTQSGYAPTQVSYTSTPPPQQPQQYPSAGGGYPQV
jgi:hypothetical protein